MCTRPISYSGAGILIRRAIIPLKGLGSQWIRRWLIENFPHKTAQDLRKVVDILHGTSTRIVEEKKAAMRSGQLSEAKDIMSILREYS